MNHRLLQLSIALACVGCGDSEGNNSSDPLSPDVHECVSYEASELADTIVGTYDEANAKPTGTLTSPDDLGGGFFDLVLTTSDSELNPGFVITAAGDDSGAIIAGTAAGLDDPTTMRGGFTGAPGQVYNIEFTQGMNAAPDAYPVGYELAWTFTGTEDCYEANDTAETAKQVPVGTEIEAYALAGYTTNFFDGTALIDWFKVVVNRDATVEAELTTPPGQHRMRIRFWEADGTTQLGSGGGNAGGETFTATQQMSAGTYLMSVEVADGEAAAWNGELPVPEFWTAPYKVDLREAP